MRRVDLPWLWIVAFVVPFPVTDAQGKHAFCRMFLFWLAFDRLLDVTLEALMSYACEMVLGVCIWNIKEAWTNGKEQ